MDRPRYLAIARNPDNSSALGYLMMIPIDGGMVVKTSDTWPRTKALYCHPVSMADWPENPELVTEIALVSCTRRGAAIDIVVDRARENRSQLVFTVARGRDTIFWQSARTQRQARPKGSIPQARAHGVVEVPITVDTREHYPYQFRNRSVITTRGALSCGDYGVYREGELYAAVERKTLDDLIGSLSNNRLRYAVGQLAALDHAAVVVEARYSAILQSTFMRPALIFDTIADYALRWPEVPVVFCENRKLAEEWTYRYLASAYHLALEASTPAESTLVQFNPTAVAIRQWAKVHDIDIPARGRIPLAIRDRYLRAHGRPTAT
jgi:hypothetical protein